MDARCTQRVALKAVRWEASRSLETNTVYTLLEIKLGLDILASLDAQTEDGKTDPTLLMPTEWRTAARGAVQIYHAHAYHG